MNGILYHFGDVIDLVYWHYGDKGKLSKEYFSLSQSGGPERTEFFMSSWHLKSVLNQLIHLPSQSGQSQHYLLPHSSSQGILEPDLQYLYLSL